LILDCVDLLRHGWLRQQQFLTCTAKIEGSGHGPKDFEPEALHPSSPQQN
jgi:hypothetical protein